MFCAFRLYGDFVWPPRPDAVDGDDKRQGLVEIYFAHFDPPGAEAGRLRAFLRWRPGAVLPVEGEAAPLPEHNIFDIDEPHEWFAEQGKNPLSVWIHGYDGEKGGEVLALRGAFLFEQPAAPGGSFPRLRWPLVRSASYGKGLENVLSELVIGQPHDPRHRGTRDNFRFNLQLPTLLPQTRIKGEAVPVFPFSVLYESDVATDAAAIRFDTLTVGPRGADIMVSAINEPADERLGAFGFAPRRIRAQGRWSGPARH